MAQLNDDCFAFGGNLMRLDQAIVAMRDLIKPVSLEETLPLEQALGRIAGHDYFASIPVPPSSNSAVDGYGLSFDDLNSSGETVLRLGERLAAGPVLRDGLPNYEPGTALRVFTGAVVPSWCDCIFMQEDVNLSEDGSQICVPPGLSKGANRREAGEDVQAGDLLVRTGQKLRPQDLALLAAQGISQIVVKGTPSLGVYSTGNELIGLGETKQKPSDTKQSLKSGQIFDSNKTLLMTATQALGYKAHDLGHLPDVQSQIECALQNAAKTHDLIITSGGVSLGEEDYVRQALEAVGRVNLWRIALKPGRPVAFGQIERTKERNPSYVVGLPGNPVAAMVTFLAVVRPLLNHLAGQRQDPFRCGKAKLAKGEHLKKKPDRLEFVRVKTIGFDEQGCRRVKPVGNKGAGILSSLVLADGLLVLKEDLMSLSSDLEEGPDQALPTSFEPADYWGFDQLFGSIS